MSLEPTPARIDASALIRLSGLAKTYQRVGAPPVHALAPTTLSLRQGEFFSLVGPSGCGKSTILNMVAGLLQPSEGSLAVAGEEVTRPRASTGIVFQKPTLLKWLNVRENILLPSKVRKAINKETLDFADHLLELTGLKAFADRYPPELSGGMQQRASIVRALVNHPTLLLMDEPFSALDEFTRENLNDELLRLWRERPKTVLFITHSIAEAVYLSDRIGVMATRPGRIEKVIDIDLNRPRAPTLRTDPRFYEIVREIRGIIVQPSLQ